MKEIWKDIEGYEGKYQVSNLGRVRSLDRKVKGANQYGATFIKGRKGKTLKPFHTITGYAKVSLLDDYNRKNFLVHRLVAEAFIPKINNKIEVNHIDGNKENNSVSNLEWCNESENQKHAYRTGLKTPLLGEKNSLSKTVLQIEINTNKVIAEFSATKEVERKLGINHSSIGACCRGEQKTAGGYIWKYKEE